MKEDLPNELANTLGASSPEIFANLLPQKCSSIATELPLKISEGVRVRKRSSDIQSNFDSSGDSVENGTSLDKSCSVRGKHVNTHPNARSCGKMGNSMRPRSLLVPSHAEFVELVINIGNWTNGKSFTGADLVAWLMRTNKTDTEDDAEVAGTVLIQKGAIKGVGGVSQFNGSHISHYTLVGLLSTDSSDSIDVNFSSPTSAVEYYPVFDTQDQRNTGRSICAISNDMLERIELCMRAEMPTHTRRASTFSRKPVKESFQGSELVMWLISKKFARDGRDAITIGNLLIHRNVIAHMTAAAPFMGDANWFKILPEMTVGTVPLKTEDSRTEPQRRRSLMSTLSGAAAHCNLGKKPSMIGSRTGSISLESLSNGNEGKDGKKKMIYIPEIVRRTTRRSQKPSSPSLESSQENGFESLEFISTVSQPDGSASPCSLRRSASTDGRATNKDSGTFISPKARRKVNDAVNMHQLCLVKQSYGSTSPLSSPASSPNTSLTHLHAEPLETSPISSPTDSSKLSRLPPKVTTGRPHLRVAKGKSSSCLVTIESLEELSDATHFALSNVRSRTNSNIKAPSQPRSPTPTHKSHMATCRRTPMLYSSLISSLDGSEGDDHEQSTQTQANGSGTDSGKDKEKEKKWKVGNRGKANSTSRPNSGACLQERTLKLRVIEAKNLPTFSSEDDTQVYCAVRVDDGLVCNYKTRTQKKTQNPFWDQSFEIALNSANFSKCIIEVWSKQRIFKDVLLGQVNIPRLFLAQDSIAHELWFPLSAETKDRDNGIPHVFQTTVVNVSVFCAICQGVLLGQGNSVCKCDKCGVVSHPNCVSKARNDCGAKGSLRAEVHFVDEVTLPLDYYSDFLDLLLENDPHELNKLRKFIAHMAAADIKATATLLMRVYEACSTPQQNHSMAFINTVCKEEVNETTSYTTIFRGNSLASKFMDSWMNRIGRSYLHDVLCPVLSDVLNKSRHSAEIDPELVEANSCTDTNLKYLSEIIEKILFQIYSSVHECPEPLRNVFSRLQSVVVQKFPDEPNARYTAISSFLFLRFFNPAILSPKQFGLADDYTDERVSRTLKLISKTIQNIANGVEFAEKEMYMRPLNALIKLHIPFVRRYIDRIALPPENRSKYIQRNLSFRAAEDTRKSKTYKSKKCPTCRNNTPKAQLNLEKDVASLTRRFNTLRQTLGGSSGSGSKTSSTPSAPTAKTRQKGKLSNTSSQASKHSSTSTTSAGESREQLCGKDGSETTSMSALLAMRTASTESFSIKGLLGNILGAVSKSEGDLCSAGETSDADSSSKYEHSETSKRFTGKESTDDGVLTQLQTGSKATDKTGSLDDVFKVPDSVGMKVGKPARAATCTTLKPAPLLKHRAQSGIALTSGMGRTISPTVKENCISMSLGRSEGLRVQQQGSSQRLGMTPNDKRGSIPERLDLVLNNLQQAAVLLQNQSRRRGAKF